MPNRLVTNQGDPLPTLTKNFEFDLGLVVQMPSGAQVTGPIALNGPGGAVIGLTPAVAGPGQVQVFATDSAADVANRVASAVGASAVRSSLNPAWVGFTAEATPGFYEFGALSSLIVATPGTSAFADATIPITIAMSEVQVRDAIQLALANEIHYADAAPSLAAFPVVGDTNAVRLYELAVSQFATSGRPLTLINGEATGTSNMPGSDFGVYSGGSSLAALLRAGERSRGLGGANGVYLDDIVIGLAERGESFTGSTQGTAMIDNPYFQALFYDGMTVRPLTQEVTSGTYQLEVRLGQEYLGDDNDGKDSRVGINQRLAEGLNLVAQSDGSRIVDGDTFTLSNGFETLRFEFNDVTIAALVTPASPSNVVINYRVSDTAGEIAQRVRDAINSDSVRSVLGIEATTASGRLSDSTDVAIFLTWLRRRHQPWRGEFPIQRKWQDSLAGRHHRPRLAAW
jgi:hypothetical protein